MRKMTKIGKCQKTDVSWNNYHLSEQYTSQIIKNKFKIFSDKVWAQSDYVEVDLVFKAFVNIFLENPQEMLYESPGGNQVDGLPPA